MQPGCFGEGVTLVDADAMDVAVNLYHVVFQAGDVALTVAPDDIRCTVVIDEDGRVDASPAVAGVETIFVGE